MEDALVSKEAVLVSMEDTLLISVHKCKITHSTGTSKHKQKYIMWAGTISVYSPVSLPRY